MRAKCKSIALPELKYVGMWSNERATSTAALLANLSKSQRTKCHKLQFLVLAVDFCGEQHFLKFILLSYARISLPSRRRKSRWIRKALYPRIAIVIVIANTNVCNKMSFDVKFYIWRALLNARQIWQRTILPYPCELLNVYFHSIWVT